MAATALNNFHKFGELPLEIRRMIWREAVRGDHGIRVIPLTQDTKRIMVMHRDQYLLSGIFLACKESNTEAEHVYGTRLAIVPFYATGTDFTSPDSLETEGHQADVQRPYGQFMRVSLQDDIFLVSPETSTIYSNKFTELMWADLSLEGGPVYQGFPGQHGPPRLMTIAVPPEIRAGMKRVMEHYTVASRDHLALSGTTTHRFDRTEFSSARVCYHFECDVNHRHEKLPHRLLFHFIQGYTGDELLRWLKPVVCQI
ncbi:uncharacterized protein PG998_004266 [Apiospora kogelbergensis]|uniref:2EXR domain-containing protein n=1 Tax=Apiospora kogelbergensis TaxID=1337665 RepID=A0AAW0QGX8_9PEZI